MIIRILQRAYHLPEVDVHREGDLVGVLPSVVVVQMKRRQAVSKCADHIRRAVARAAHFRVPDVKACDQKRVVHRVDMTAEILARRTGGKGGFILFFVPQPHIFGRDLHAAGLCKGEQVKEKFSVFLGGFVIVGMNDTDLGTDLGGAFDGALQGDVHTRIIAGEGRVRLVAYDAAVLAHAAQVPRVGQVIPPAERVVGIKGRHVHAVGDVAHTEHRKIPSIKPCACDHLDRLLLADPLDGGIYFG